MCVFGVFCAEPTLCAKPQAADPLCRGQARSCRADLTSHLQWDRGQLKPRNSARRADETDG